MIKLLVAGVLSFHLLCANELQVEDGVANWATDTASTIPFGLIHVSCDKPFLGHAACTLYFQNWRPQSGDCNINGCVKMRPGAEVKP